MCGIGGILSTAEDVQKEHLAGIVSTLRHRGPDGNGAWVEGKVGLCHTRLAILDLSEHATQPMRSKDDRFAITFNGEIFNFKTLRKKLDDVGVTVTSTGDTEVLLEYIARFGVGETLDQLEGQYAFGVWDRRERVLHLARDRHGIKPLYYGRSGGKIVFASEMKALLDISEVDPACVDGMLLGLACTWGARTPFGNVKSVQPGELVTFNAHGESTARRFFRMSQLINVDLFNELDRAPKNVVLDRVDATLAESMDIQIVSDAPLACLLSGGLDSCLISACAFERVQNVSFFHADVTSNSELGAARLAADALNGDLYTTTVDDNRFINCIPEVVFANDLPAIYHPNSMPFYLVCKLAHQHGIKVLLTGEGSDELFIGYPKTIIDPLVGKVNGLSNIARKAIERVSPSFAEMVWPDASKSLAKFLQRMVFMYETELIDEDCQNAVRNIKSRHERKICASSLALLESHLSSLLHRNDRMGMAWSLESRFPFLDTELTKLALNLPSRYKLRRSLRIGDRRHPFVIDKWCVRKLCEKRMPYRLSQRSKRGFPTSASDRIALKSQFFREGFFTEWYKIPARVMDKILSSSQQNCIYNLMMMEIWGQMFVQRRGLASVTQSFAENVGIHSK